MLTAMVSVATIILLILLVSKTMAVLNNTRLVDKNAELRKAKEALDISNQQLADERDLLKRTEIKLRFAQKLEAIGQLTAGIAHDINTPMQFIGDHVDFLETAHNDLQTLLLMYKKLHVDFSGDAVSKALIDDINALEAKIDLPFLQKKCPEAFEKTQLGVKRVSKIVQAMNEFAYPSQTEKAVADINKAIENTLTVANNEYKYIAEVETELRPLPPLLCHIGDLNQVFLNLIVNAAHAIEAKGETNKGLIRIETQYDNNEVEIRIADSGEGIEKEIQSKIFDPFFTTKVIGKGSGQGLAITHSIVVEKHLGNLAFESDEDRGTTFIIRLPINDAALSRVDKQSINYAGQN